jgi:hypothetical protein
VSILSHLLGLDYKAPVQAGSLFKNPLVTQLEDPNYGQDQLAKTTQATVQDALPDFLKNLGGLREDNIRRGISTGDLGSSFEGDLTSAFQRNIANSVAGQSANMFNTRTNLLYGGQEDALDREQAAQNDAGKRKSSFLSGLISTIGQIAGSAAGAHH